MRFEALLAFTGACLCSVLGVGALYNRPHALVSRAFTLGMLVLALWETLVGSIRRIRPPRGLPRGPVRVLRGPAVGRRLGGRRDPRRADQRRLASPRQLPAPSPAPAGDG